MESAQAAVRNASVLTSEMGVAVIGCPILVSAAAAPLPPHQKAHDARRLMLTRASVAALRRSSRRQLRPTGVDCWASLRAPGPGVRGQVGSAPQESAMAALYRLGRSAEPSGSHVRLGLWLRRPKVASRNSVRADKKTGTPARAKAGRISSDLTDRLSDAEGGSSQRGGVPCPSGAAAARSLDHGPQAVYQDSSTHPPRRSSNGKGPHRNSTTASPRAPDGWRHRGGIAAPSSVARGSQEGRASASHRGDYDPISDAKNTNAQSPEAGILMETPQMYATGPRFRQSLLEVHVVESEWDVRGIAAAGWPPTEYLTYSSRLNQFPPT
ncbi:hypothetical protein PHYSODRAFT_329782 [Phytophthora sojae]|uniref:Uncharacterized protein n=1 Tax=Phytophthora sojae (strain P6497) TaxID=1094619 RepID=G4Z8H0_PHYSP|nr:hypothetical protein PHYSODRAFT_329782 [Phytophthora sojae]EGZ21890.1 hypothetical protein PHYSODRAFT_329782 [Phytophthora sojae]|eukprot:XP_009524607.1 hypothetical protein PHYSODRAFT_329782 [Phytophthora sojae]